MTSRICFRWLPVRFCCARGRIALALSADELLLVVNGNVPISIKTAEYYAKERQVPDGRIVKLNLPAGEEISFDRYERDIVPVIRQYLRDHELQDKVKCLVTFYGTPIRIGAKQLTAAEIDEAAQIKQQFDATAAKIVPSVDRAESLAKKADPAFVPLPGTSYQQLVARADASLAWINKHLPSPEATDYHKTLVELVELVTAFGGEAQLAAKLSDAETKELLPATRAAEWPARRRQLEEYQTQIRLLQEKRYDPDARKKAREIAADGFGLLGLGGALEAQQEYLTTDGTVSALDNELPLLWWNYYRRSKWVMNPLNYHFKGPHPQTLMVMRLDGPQEGTATQIIQASLKAEKDGLKGRIVIDSNGGSVPGAAANQSNGYREYDQKLLHLAQIVQAKTKFVVLLDKHPAVLPPNSAKDVALYCGWYSLRNYVPSCQFNPGAVGYHIASFEMVSLRGENEHGWVAGLLNDGIASTLGPVAEPYLAAFPPPDEFFPLLMTGKLTLAEVYWKTTPLASWMMSCIGDPLYTPFKADPLLKEEDLDPAMRAALTQ